MPDVWSTTLRRIQVCREESGKLCVTCEREANLDEFLRIQLGLNFILRNIVRKVSNDNIETPVTGSTVLKSLGSNRTEMIMAARDNYGWDIDLKERLNQDENGEELSEKLADLFVVSEFLRWRCDRGERTSGWRLICGFRWQPARRDRSKTGRKSKWSINKRCVIDSIRTT